MKKIALWLERLVVVTVICLGVMMASVSFGSQNAVAAEGGGGGDGTGYYVLDLDLLPADPCPIPDGNCAVVVVTPEQ